MKCDHCSEPATVFLTQLIDGEMKKTMLCQNCAEEKGFTDPTGFALAEFLGGPDEEVEEDVEAVDLLPAESALDQCPNCGFTLEKLRKVGRLGCSQCYKAFRSEITPMLRNMHGAKHHEGKIPDFVPSSTDSEEKLKSLHEQLQAAIDAEDFESAASLRDEIRSSEAKTSGGASS